MIPGDRLVRDSAILPASNSSDLLAANARYQDNSDGHTWNCGSLLSNDLGLFDMLGNESKWCQDTVDAFRPSKKGIYYDIIIIYNIIYENKYCITLGGAYNSVAAVVRSAHRRRVPPSRKVEILGDAGASPCGRSPHGGGRGRHRWSRLFAAAWGSYGAGQVQHPRANRLYRVHAAWQIVTVTTGESTGALLVREWCPNWAENRSTSPRTSALGEGVNLKIAAAVESSSEQYFTA